MSVPVMLLNSGKFPELPTAARLWADVWPWCAHILIFLPNKGQGSSPSFQNWRCSTVDIDKYSGLPHEPGTVSCRQLPQFSKIDSSAAMLLTFLDFD